MAQTPAERRASRDASARKRINPVTGKPFNNYNQLDTWQRNQKARAEGFTGRGQKRGAIRKGKLSSRQEIQQDQARLLPNSYRFFLNGRDSSEELATEFNYALGPLPKKPTADDKWYRRAQREFILRFNQGINWPQWRNEYDAVYG